MGLFSTQSSDILGLNARALEYTKRVNLGAASKLANKKLATKRRLQKDGIATPRLHAKIQSREKLHAFRWTKLPASFVLKPNNASGGGGVMVAFGRNKKGNWVKGDKSEIFIPELKNHVLDILDGNFSPGHVPDIAFFEQRIQLHPSLKPYSYRGVPDIRVLVYNHVPVMAMLRLPTAESRGRANLHVGGIGVGIELVHGYTTTAIHNGRIIETLPNKPVSLSGIRVPYWKDILVTAVRAADSLGLAFAGVDIAIDRDDGPLVLEVNARPGLDIQFANLTPLKSRLRRVSGLSVKTPEKGVALAHNLFGADILDEIQDVSGRIVLGIEEEIELVDKEGESHTLRAKVDTGAWRTTIDERLAESWHLDTPVIEHKSVRAALGRATRPVVNASFKLRGRLIKTRVFLADRSKMKYDAIIGRRDLKGFLVDPQAQKAPRG